MFAQQALDFWEVVSQMGDGSCWRDSFRHLMNIGWTARSLLVIPEANSPEQLQKERTVRTHGPPMSVKNYRRIELMAQTAANSVEEPTR